MLTPMRRRNVTRLFAVAIITGVCFAVPKGLSLMDRPDNSQGPSLVDRPEKIDTDPETKSSARTLTGNAMPEHLAEADRDFLAEHGWPDRVGDERALWVSVTRQILYAIENDAIVWQYPCATAAAGTGSKEGSLRPPLGWHAVSEKFGDDAPSGQVFRARAATREVWKPGDESNEDLVLTRILWLDGLEPGKNKGKSDAGENVDSKRRYIYIHGTNHEDQIGTPSSHGCVRLKNADVIDVYERVPVGTKVLITQGALPTMTPSE